MLTAIGGFSWWGGVLVAMKNDGTGLSCVSGVGRLQQQPWKEGWQHMWTAFLVVLLKYRVANCRVKTIVEEIVNW